jgi:hypothetical protein
MLCIKIYSCISLRLKSKKIKLQLICIIENIVLHVGIHRTDMCRKQPPKKCDTIFIYQCIPDDTIRYNMKIDIVTLD